MLRIPSYDEFQALNESLPPQYILDKWKREGYVPQPEPFHALVLTAEGEHAESLRSTLEAEGVEFTSQKAWPDSEGPRANEVSFCCEKIGDYSTEGSRLERLLKERNVRYDALRRMH